VNMKKIKLKSVSKSRGFTLIELFTLLGIVGVAMSLAVPEIRTSIVRSEIVTMTNEMILSLKLARSEAIVRGKDTIVCSSTDSSTCSKADGNWINGWIVGVDLNNDNNIKEADGELLWAYKSDVSPVMTITPSATVFNQLVSFSYNGWLNAGDGVGFDICSGLGATSGFQRREIRSSVAGEPKLTINAGLQC